MSLTMSCYALRMFGESDMKPVTASHQYFEAVARFTFTRPAAT